MALIYDLHAHSTASDGTLAPSALMQMAFDAGVRVMALTDHDSTEGVAEAANKADQLGMRFIPGAEISVTWNAMTIHIVGLSIDPENAELQQGLAKLREYRDWRALEIGRKLEKAGVRNAYEGAKALSNGRLISRTHFARYLVEQGFAKDVGDVFKHFLVSNRPGHVRGEWAELSDVISWIKNAGGQAVIAHPARYKMTRSKLRKLIGEFKDAGGDAIEVVSGSHSKDDYHTMAVHAQDFDLSASAGSDFHDPAYPWIVLGTLPELPQNCRPIWHDWPLP